MRDESTRKRRYKFNICLFSALQDLTLAVMVATLVVLPVRALGQSTPPREGDLDTSFSGDGKVITGFGADRHFARAIAIQNDGKIVVAGFSVVNASEAADLVMARYLSNGALDTSFSGDGKVRNDFGGRVVDAYVALQPDGKIIVAGRFVDAAGDSSLLVARYLVNGTLDNTFSGNGWVTTPIGSDTAVASVIVQPDGKIVAAGSTNFDDDIFVARYRPNGNLDTNFNGVGWVITDFETAERAKAVALQPDGKIVVAGTLNESAILVLRYRSNGSLDPTFNGTGWVSDNVAQVSAALAVQPDGKIVVASWSAIDSSEFFASHIARFTSKGALDPEFGTGGKVRVDFGTGFMHTATGLALQPDNKIVVGGFLLAFDEVDPFALARYTPNGTLDTTFGSDGNVVTAFGSDRHAAAHALTIQPHDGRIVLAGTTGLIDSTSRLDFAVARYHAISCNSVVVTRIGTAGGDTITGTSGDDVIYGFGGNDFIDGRGGNDIICGGTGNDTLEGGGGDDILRGGPGTDICRGEGHVFRDKASECETVTGVP
jgi:uncharacterized delta-60 repeat protein